jgi:nitric oxide reductase NorD protein
MGLDEKFFNWILKLKLKSKNQRIEKKLLEQKAFFTPDHEGELSVFASLLWQRAIEVKAMDGAGDFDQKTLFLPKIFCLGNTHEINRSAALLRILHEHQYSLGKKSNELIQSELEELYSKYAELLSLVRTQSLKDSNIIWPSLRKELVEAAKLNLETKNEDEVEHTKGAEAHLKTLPKGRLKHLDELKKDNIGDQVFHSFEKIETVEEYKGVSRQAEAEDQLLEKAKALEELNLDTVIRSQESSSQTYHVDAIGGFEVGDLENNPIPESQVQKYLYDEWDKVNHQYKREWCTILERKLLGSRSDLKKIDIEITQKELKKLKDLYLKLRVEKKTQKNLFNGPEIDIDKIVRNFSCHMAKQSGEERVYQSKVKRERDLATFILLDTSLSADSWVRNVRVLDETLHAMMLLSQLLRDFKDSFAVAAFYSNTRTQCHFDILKDFSDSWHAFERRIPEIEAQGYTRMGAPIRHATSLLSKQREKRKLLLVLSDGKPTDFDRYEGGYGISDTARAIEEASHQGVFVHALTFEDSSKTVLPRLFGRKNYTLLKKRSDIALALSNLLLRLTRETLS